jgi:ATP adenylyltransferase
MMNNTTTKPLVDIDNSREAEQTEVMKDILAAEHCPFCMENLRQYHKEPILKDGQFWLLTPNQWPYKNTKLHLLAIYKEHAENLTELNPEAGRELFEFLAWAQREYQVPGGGFAMRFGDTRHSAGTVLHIHAQFLMPDLEAPDYQPTRFKIGKSPEKL